MMKRYGFTLVELMVVMLIFAIIMAAIFGVLVMYRRSWQIGVTQVELQQGIRWAMSRMVNELRQSRTGKITDVPADGTPSNRATFYMPEDIDV